MIAIPTTKGPAMADDDKPLFRKKRIGYGWSPNRAGGWLIMLVIIWAFIAITLVLRR
jgi:uncharacterized membrane protein